MSTYIWKIVVRIIDANERDMCIIYKKYVHIPRKIKQKW